MVKLDNKGKVICWFSCGVTSAVACKIAAQVYGVGNVNMYYIDIGSAHEDNKRFITQCEQWIGAEIKITSNNKFKDQFEVIEGTQYINGPHGARCTKELKKNVRFKIETESGYPPQVFGFEYTKDEINRALRFREQYPMANAVFPLIENKVTKSDAMALLLINGIELPAMYKLGYHNNNCIGCVKGGMGYWNKIKKDFPDVFLRMATLEREIERSCINGIYLDELTPTDGHNQAPILPDCGTFCEIKHVNLIHKRVDEIYNNPSLIKQ